MKFFRLHFASLILLAKSVSAFNPHFFFPGPHVTEASDDNEGQPVTIPASTLRLILASKLGVSRYHSIEYGDEETFAILSDYLGKSFAFKQHDGGNEPTAILFVEGAESLRDVIPDEISHQSTKMILEIQPGYEANRRLLADLASQRAEMNAATKPNIRPHGFQSEAERILGLELTGGSQAYEWAKINDEARTMIAHSVMLDHRNITQGMKGTEYKNAKANVQNLVRTLFGKAASHNWNVIIAVMPFAPKGHGLPKRSADPWGTYDLPLSVRQEEPSLDTSARPTVNQEGTFYPMQNNYPAGILKECYSTKGDCTKATRNCSGHGSCSLKYSYKSEETSVQCFSCACQPETSTNSDGSKKITYWAGPACQKIDVSTPFWLLGGVTLGLVIVIAWAIGLLYGMGQQELPSVIGAGVAGPRAR